MPVNFRWVSYILLVIYLALLFPDIATNLISGENRRQISAILCADLGRSAKIALAAPGTPGDFRWSAYKKAKRITWFKLLDGSRPTLARN